ncbi:MAG: AI-2E family transporter, partial [Myxococcota bacterium]
MGTDPGSDFGDPLQATEDRRRRMFFGIWGAVLFIALVTFREVLVPFSFAIVLAYVMAPLVRRIERKDGETRGLPRWAAVTTVYLLLVGLLGAFVSFGVPRLAVEIERLAFEVPRAVNTARDEWLPELERRFRGAMESYDGNERHPVGSRAATGDDGPDVVTSAEGEVERPPSIRILPEAPDEGGGFRVDLPGNGLIVEPQGEGFRVRMARTEESAE